MQLLNDILQSTNRIEKIRESLPTILDLPAPKLTNKILESRGFKAIDEIDDCPAQIIWNTNGKFLGNVLGNYESIQPIDFFDTIVENCNECEVEGINLDNLECKFWDGEQKMEIRVDLPDLTFKLPNGNIDEVKKKLSFLTGFGGKMRTIIGLYSWRQICGNGMHAWVEDENASMKAKHTKRKNSQVLEFCGEIYRQLEMSTIMDEQWKKMSTIKVSNDQVEKYIDKVFGIKDRKTMSTRMNSIIHDVNEAMAEEFAYGDRNIWTMLNGVTRYTNHMAVNASDEYITTATGRKTNDVAQQIALEMI